MLDELDREILGILLSDGRISYRDLGERVSLSANAAAERLRRLVRVGVITGFHAAVDHSRMSERGLHRIEDDLAETWLEDWAGAGVADPHATVATTRTARASLI